ncbi:hypothetical protein KCU62_g7787, partial [Aureobasidium sp. EXF-3399]
MAPKKKKKNAPRKHAGRARVDQKATKNPTQNDPDDDEPSTSSVNETDAVVPVTPEKKNLLFTLPLELRIKIWGLVLSTGDFHEETQSHMYKIGERRQQRRHNIHSRIHNYTLDNIKYNHFALLQTCWTIFEDITSCVNITASFSFANAEVLATFAAGPLATPYCFTRSRDKNFEDFAISTLDEAWYLDAGNLRMLAFAKVLKVVEPGRFKSVEDILGRAIISRIEERYNYFR